MKKIDMNGKTFGRLYVLDYDGRGPSGQAVWICGCECGRITKVPGYKLRSGHTKSCGCLKTDTARAARTRHGMSKTRTYRCWGRMIDRCASKGKDAKWYRDKGITVCDEWRDFMVFYGDMGEIPHGATLDRIDSAKGYAPGNCRWASTATQARNRDGVVLDYDAARRIRGEYKSGETQASLAKKYGVTQSAISCVVLWKTWRKR